MEKKVSFQALQANELIKFLPKKEVFAQKKKGILRYKKGKICYSAWKLKSDAENLFLTEIIRKHNTSSGSETHVNLTAKKHIKAIT